MAAERPLAALSLMLEADYRAAALPLFEAGTVEAIEWSFDMEWIRADRGLEPLPSWAAEFLDHYAAADRLFGHGVTFSPFSARFEERQGRWLERLEREVRGRSYQHVSEHFGFMTAGDVVDGAPLPVPRCDAALEVGRDRLRRLRAAAGTPVGLENLALALSPRDVADQGAFLSDVLTGDDFLVLDLHNLWCQAVNFERPVDELLATYPLDRVRELHVSGGSWQDDPAGRFRRDTHDGPTPDPVFSFLPRVLDACEHVELVVLERLGSSMDRPNAAEELRRDFETLREALA